MDDMTSDERLVSDRFPRSSTYHPEWLIAGASSGANALWLVEWLTEALDLRSDMRVLDLGCGWAPTVSSTATIACAPRSRRLRGERISVRSF